MKAAPAIHCRAGIFKGRFMSGATRRSTTTLTGPMR